MFKSKLLKTAKKTMNRGLLIQAFQALDSHLSLLGQAQTVTITGGAAMVLQGLKAQTPDVDAISPMDPELTAGIEEVGDHMKLDPDWFNFAASGHYINDIPQDGLTELWSGKALKVLGPNPQWLFLKKAEAARHGKDQDDVVEIVKALGWNTAQAEKTYKTMTGKPMPQNIYYHLMHYVG